MSLDSFLELNCLEFFKNKLKQYVQINNFKSISDEFYTDWLNVFQEEYQKSFKFIVKNDDYAFRSFIISALEISNEEYNIIKNGILSKIELIHNKL